MPLNPIQFPIIEQYQGSPVQNAAMNVENLHKTQAENFIKELEGRNYQDEINSKLAMQHAQALNQYNQAMGIGGHKGKGENEYAPHDYIKLENAYDKEVAANGENSPKAKRIAAARDAWISSHGENRWAPPEVVKLQNSREAIRSKYGPNSQEERDLDLVLNKVRSDEAIRTRAVQATQLEQSMDAINIPAITRYSGPEGAFQLLRDQALDLAGHAPEEYKEYQKSLVAAKMEAKQLRQMLGESVREKLAKELEALTNPASIGKSPETAALMLEKYRDIIKRELRTIQKAQTSTEPYLGAEGKEEAIKKVEPGNSSRKHKPYTHEDIVETSRQTGKTVAEIEELIRKAEEGK